MSIFRLSSHFDFLLNSTVDLFDFLLNPTGSIVMKNILKKLKLIVFIYKLKMRIKNIWKTLLFGFFNFCFLIID